jgi:hypothetical protein
VSGKLAKNPHGQSVHGPDCPCLRCKGFSEGNDIATRHGAYSSSLKLVPRAHELADEIRATLPGVFGPADEIAIGLLATALCRIELAVAAIEQIDDKAATPLSPYLAESRDALGRLRADLRGWISQAMKIAAELGMTPSSRARLGLDVAMTRKTLNVIELHEQARREEEQT